MDHEALFSFGTVMSKTAISVAFLLLAVTFRLLLVRWISRKDNVSAEVRRRWLVNSRNTLIYLLLAGFIFIWVNELRTLAVSLLALAVAFVIATKELILCVSGSLLRRVTDAYDLGDRIEVAGLRGEVIDINFFGTSLREIGPGKTGQQYTGRRITLPHSLLLNNAVTNETFTGEFQLHLFSVPWKYEDDWQQAETRLLAAAREECGETLETARRHMKMLEDREGLEQPSLEPRVTLEIPEPGRINFQVRVPVAADRVTRVEQAILRRFLQSASARPADPST